MTFKDLKKHNFVVKDKQTGFTLSDNEKFFLDDKMNLCIKDTDKNGKFKINKVDENLYELVIN